MICQFRRLRVVQAGQGKFAIQLSVDCANPTTTPVHGAGRSFRVQQDTVAKNAVAFLRSDLERFDGLSFCRKFTETVVLRDRKCTLAAFQASTSMQRLKAFSAALTRMGLHDKAQEVADLPKRPLNPQGQQETDAATANRPRAAQEHVQCHTDREDDQLQPERTEDPSPDAISIQTRVRALEAWAHALDSQLALGDDESDRAVVRARELLDVMAKQAVQDALQDHCDDLKATLDRHSEKLDRLETGLACSPQAGPPPPTCDVRPSVPFTSGCSSQAGAQGPALQHPACPVAVQIAALSHQVNFCLRLCKRGLTQSSQSEAGLRSSVPVPSSALSAVQRHLAWMHTTAISRSWQWTASMVKATSTLGQSAPPQPPGRAQQSATRASPRVVQSACPEAPLPCTLHEDCSVVVESNPPPAGALSRPCAPATDAVADDDSASAPALVTAISFEERDRARPPDTTQTDRHQSAADADEATDTLQAGESGSTAVTGLEAVVELSDSDES
eukprot:2950500-Amphidinium_carterae.5